MQLKILKSVIEIVIPACDEADSLPSVLSGVVDTLGKIHMIVINDGSRDKTDEIARLAGAKVISLSVNRGVGYALRAGLLCALSSEVCFYVIQMDADGQHNPADLPLLINAVKTTGADVVIGSRYVEKPTYKTSFFRRMGICMLSMAIRWRTGRVIHDPTSGYRIYNRRAAKFVTENCCGRCPEALVVARLLSHGFKVEEIAISMQPRRAGKSKLTFMIGLHCVWRNILMILFS